MLNGHYSGIRSPNSKGMMHVYYIEIKEPQKVQLWEHVLILHSFPSADRNS